VFNLAEDSREMDDLLSDSDGGRASVGVVLDAAAPFPCDDRSFPSPFSAFDVADCERVTDDDEDFSLDFSNLEELMGLSGEN